MKLVPAFFLAAAAAAAQSNLSLDAGPTNSLPTGWVFNPTANSSTASFSRTGCRNAACAVISASTSGQGELGQAFSASPHIMRRLRFQSYVRSESPAATVRAWITIRRSDSFLVLSRSTALVAPNQWTPLSLTADVADGSRISIGWLFLGTGRVFVDDASFETVAELQRDSPEPPRPLSVDGLRNVTAFARLAGFIRHYHPSDQAASADWDALLVQGVRRVEDADSLENLASRLEEIFRPVAPTVRVFPAAATPPVVPELDPPQANSLARIYRRNLGAPSDSSGIYSSTRVTVPAGDPLPAEASTPPNGWLSELVPGLRAHVPLTLYLDNGATLPAAPPPDYGAWIHSGDDRASRLAGIIIAWNMMRHFFPYFDATTADWNAALPAFLSRAALDSDALAYLRTLRRLNALLRDGHGGVNYPITSTFAPVKWNWVGDDLILVNGPRDVLPGDRVLSLDGVPLAEAAAALAEEVSASTRQWERWRLLSELAVCPRRTNLTLEIEPFAAPGTRRTVTLGCGFNLEQSRPDPRPDAIATLEPGILYVDLGRATTADIQAAAPRLAAARGLVFDMRGYPTSFAILGYLTRQPLASAHWNVPVTTQPDQANLVYQASRWFIDPVEPYFSARRVILTDGRAISAAETMMAIFEAYGLAEILGATTAGTNGNVNPFDLPGGYRFSWTGMRVLKHDNATSHQGVGVAPQLPLAPTREGIAAGFDELLAAAVARVKQ